MPPSYAMQFSKSNPIDWDIKYHIHVPGTQQWFLILHRIGFGLGLRARIRWCPIGWGNGVTPIGRQAVIETGAELDTLALYEQPSVTEQNYSLFCSGLKAYGLKVMF